MTTVDTVVTQTRQKLVGVSGRDRLTGLFAAVPDAVATSINTIGADGIRVGSTIALGYERLYVAVVAGNVLTALRGYAGTTAVAHDQTQLIDIEPRWPADVVLAELIAELRSWPSSLHATTTATVTFPTGTGMVDLGSPAGVPVHRVLSATAIDGTRHGRLSLSLLRGMDTAVYPSGVAVALPPGWAYGTPTDIRVTYAHGFDTSAITPTTDLETTVGLAPSMLDILPYGIGVRMMAGKDAQRNDLVSQGQQRSASEVPPQSWAKSASLWQQMREARISQEATRLLDTYPWRAA